MLIPMKSIREKKDVFVPFSQKTNNKKQNKKTYLKSSWKSGVATYPS